MRRRCHPVNSAVLNILWQCCRLLGLVLLTANLASIAGVQAQSPAQIRALRKETEDLFYHGYENYMTYAFPEDELRPISCKPLTRDRDNPAHIEVNDPLGNYSLTLIDSLSTLAILASTPPTEEITRHYDCSKMEYRPLLNNMAMASRDPQERLKSTRV